MPGLRFVPLIAKQPFGDVVESVPGYDTEPSDASRIRVASGAKV